MQRVGNGFQHKAIIHYTLSIGLQLLYFFFGEAGYFRN